MCSKSAFNHGLIRSSQPYPMTKSSKFPAKFPATSESCPWQTGLCGLPPPPASRPGLARRPRVWKGPTVPQVGGARSSLPRRFDGLLAQRASAFDQNSLPFCPKSLGAKFRSPGCSSHALGETKSLRKRKLALDDDRGMFADRAAANHSAIRFGRRLQTQRRPLIGPRHRQVDQSSEAEAAGKAAIDSGFDKVGREERQRQGHTDRPLALALPSGNRFDGLRRVAQKFV
jgi:hypothetical protein